MEAVTKFFAGILSQLDKASFALLAVIDFSAFGAIFVLALVGCIFSDRLRAHSKRGFFHIVNIFSALTLVVFLTEFTLAQSVAVSAVFWCAGYLLYGVLNVFKVKRAPLAQSAPAPVSAPPQPAAGQVRRAPMPQTEQTPPAATSVVRLEHALSIADKLLLKNLGRGDRQELEKIKTALTVLKVKGILSAQEGEALNEMFNALLKLMAKYDL